MAKLVGCDAGCSGAVALFNTDIPDEVEVINMPLNEDRQLDSWALFDKLSDWGPDYLIVENCWQPITLTRMVGELCCIGKILQAEVNIIAVVTWKKAMLGKNTSDKSISVTTCQKLMPKADLRISARAKKPSPDRAEAVLLALYAQQLWTGKS